MYPKHIKCKLSFPIQLSASPFLTELILSFNCLLVIITHYVFVLTSSYFQRSPFFSFILTNLQRLFYVVRYIQKYILK